MLCIKERRGENENENKKKTFRDCELYYVYFHFMLYVEEEKLCCCCCETVFYLKKRNIQFFSKYFSIELFTIYLRKILGTKYILYMNKHYFQDECMYVFVV